MLYVTLKVKTFSDELRDRLGLVSITTRKSIQRGLGMLKEWLLGTEGELGVLNIKPSAYNDNIALHSK